MKNEFNRVKIRQQIQENCEKMSLSQNPSDYYDLEAIDLHDDQQSIIDKLHHQMKEIGFLKIKNAPNFDEELLYYWTQWFFNQSDEEKQELYRRPFNPNSPNIYRGLMPFLKDDPSYKEIFDIGLDYSKVHSQEQQTPLHEPTPYPKSEFGQQFYQFIKQHYDYMHKIALLLMGYLAKGLHKPENYFNPFIEHNTLSTMRIIHYEPRPNRNQQDPILAFTTMAHTDSTLLTLLSTFNYIGLQVEIDGQFRYIKPEPGALVINLGDMMHRISGGNFKSTVHRVVDIGVTRFSSPFFLEPSYLADLNDDLFNHPQKSGFCYGDWLIQAMSQKYGEWKNFQQELKQKKQQ